MPRKKKTTKRAQGGIAYESKRKKYKVTLKGEYIGRFNTKPEAEEALYNYLHRPEIKPDCSTFQNVYEKWYSQHLRDEVKKQGRTVVEIESSSSFKGHRAAYSNFKNIHNEQFAALKIVKIEDEIKNKNQPSQRKMKVLIHYMADYALRHDVIDGGKFNEFYAVRIDEAIQSEKHYPFSSDEVKKLSEAADDMYIQMMLMCIYSGCRCGEILALKKSDVNLDSDCFWIHKGKNRSARRAVPIHKKTKKFFQNWMTHNDSDYLITRLDGKPINTKTGYEDFLNTYWIPKLKSIGIYHYIRENGDEAVHLPHDMRVTFATMWAEKGLDQTIRKKIQGHSTGDVGIDVYTKPFISTLLKEINKL